MAILIASEACETLGIRSEIGNSGIDHAACTLGQPGKAKMARCFARSVKDKPQSLRDQVAKLAAAQRRLGLGSTIELVGNLDGGLHCSVLGHITIKLYLWHPVDRIKELEVEMGLGREVVAERLVAGHRTFTRDFSIAETGRSRRRWRISEVARHGR
jgi:hypothetical protein